MVPRTRRNLRSRTATTKVIADAAKPPKETRVQSIFGDMQLALNTETKDAPNDLELTRQWITGVVQTYKGRFGDNRDSPLKMRRMKRVRRSADEKENKNIENFTSCKEKTKKGGTKAEEKHEIDVSALLVKELRKELQKRGLETGGLKKVLQKRLTDAIQEEKAREEAKNTVPQLVEEKSPEVTESDSKKTSVESPFQKILDEGSKAVICLDLTEDTPTRVEVPKKNSVEENEETHGNIDVKPMDISNDVVMEESKDDIGKQPPPPPNTTMMDIQDTSKDFPLIVVPGKNTKAMENDTVSMLTMESDTEALATKKTIGKMLKATVKYLSPKKAPKSPRAMFNKYTDELENKKPENVNIDVSEKCTKKVHNTKPAVPQCAPKKDHGFNGLPVTKMLTGTLHKTASTANTNNKNKTSQQQLQDKKKKLMAARKARLEEMRGKSKTALQLRELKAKEALKKAGTGVAKINFMSKPSSGVSTLAVPVLKANTVAKGAAAQLISVEEKKRQLREAQIRERAAAEAKRIKAKMEDDKLKKMQKKILPPPQAPPPPPPMEVENSNDNYEISDKEDCESDESSSDESDDERKPKKRFAQWTKKEYLAPALDRQFCDWPGRSDPEAIFTEIETCDLNAIFDSKKSRYQRRTSSGNWEKDRVTPMEKLVYRRQMGF